MTAQKQELCDRCHERPAVSNICYGHGGEGRSLCEVCLKQDPEVGGLMQRMSEAIRAGKCKYCGAPAETIFGGHFSPISGEIYNLVCMTCYKDLAEFVRRPKNATPHFAPGDQVALRKATTFLADFNRRKDEFIKQRVLERKRSDN